MSHVSHVLKKCFLVLYVVVWCSLFITAGVRITLYLVGTLGDPLSAQARDTIDTPEVDSVETLTNKKVVRYLGEWEFSEPKLPGHFHHIGQWYQSDTHNFCIKCHGGTPHSRSPQLRAFLNMHNLFISCQVCHTREQADVLATRFGWLDLDTHALRKNPDMEEGKWGEYGAKIVPLKDTTETPEPLILSKEAAFTADFRKKMDRLTDSQKAKGNKVIHRRCIDVPIRCNDCHNTQKAYLPYTDLGYSEDRAAFLVSAEVVDLVARYETFYLPDLLNTQESPDNNKDAVK